MYKRCFSPSVNNVAVGTVVQQHAPSNPQRGQKAIVTMPCAPVIAAGVPEIQCISGDARVTDRCGFFCDRRGAASEPRSRHADETECPKSFMTTAYSATFCRY